MKRSVMALTKGALWRSSRAHGTCSLPVATSMQRKPYLLRLLGDAALRNRFGAYSRSAVERRFTGNVWRQTWPQFSVRTASCRQRLVRLHTEQLRV
jgi:hypothetical protein